MFAEQGYTPPVWVLKAALMCSLIVVCCAGLISANGALPAIKWIIIFCLTTAAFLPLVVTLGLFTLLETILNAVVGFFQKILDILINNGQAILGLFGWQPKEQQMEVAAPAASAPDSAPIGEYEATASEPGPAPADKPESGQADEFNYTVSSKGFDPMGVGA